jgi:hypothetical protein
MNKKLKILLILNIISYLIMTILSVVIINDIFPKFDLITKFTLGISPYILITCTSFILASDRFLEFKSIKIEAIIDWVVRIIAFVIIINYSKHFKSLSLALAFVAFSFIVNTIIEYRINKKLISIKDRKSNGEKIEITYEEKCNLNAMVKAASSGLILIIIFPGFSLSVPLIKNMEGATAATGYIPIIISIVVFIRLITSSYENYIMFYLDKKYAKKIYTRDIIFASIGFMICFISAFFKMSYEAYSYIFLGGLLLLLPMIGTVRKMSLRVKKVKDSLDRESFRYFLTKKRE